MNATDRERLVRSYRQDAIQHRDSSESGDHRTANRAYDALKKLFERLSVDEPLAEQILTELLHDRDMRVRTWAASHSHGLGKHVKEAEEVLAEVSQADGPSMLSFTGKKTLEVWKKPGYLKF